MLLADASRASVLAERETITAKTMGRAVRPVKRVPLTGEQWRRLMSVEGFAVAVRLEGPFSAHYGAIDVDVRGVVHTLEFVKAAPTPDDFILWLMLHFGHVPTAENGEKEWDRDR